MKKRYLLRMEIQIMFSPGLEASYEEGTNAVIQDLSFVFVFARSQGRILVSILCSPSFTTPRFMLLIWGVMVWQERGGKFLTPVCKDRSPFFLQLTSLGGHRKSRAWLSKPSVGHENDITETEPGLGCVDLRWPQARDPHSRPRLMERQKERGGGHAPRRSRMPGSEINPNPNLF